MLQWLERMIESEKISEAIEVSEIKIKQQNKLKRTDNEQAYQIPCCGGEAHFCNSSLIASGIFILSHEDSSHEILKTLQSETF